MRKATPLSDLGQNSLGESLEFATNSSFEIILETLHLLKILQMLCQFLRQPWPWFPIAAEVRPPKASLLNQALT